MKERSIKANGQKLDNSPDKEKNQDELSELTNDYTDKLKKSSLLTPQKNSNVKERQRRQERQKFDCLVALDALFPHYFFQAKNLSPVFSAWENKSDTEVIRYQIQYRLPYDTIMHAKCVFQLSVLYSNVVFS